MPKTTDDLGEKIHFRVGETIYAQGSETKGVYLLLDGKVDIWRNDDNDTSHVASINGGELLGEVSVIEKRPHSVTAKATEETSALFIDAPSFRRSFSDPLVRHVVHTLAARLRSSYTAQKTKKIEAEPIVFKSRKPTLEGGSRLVANKLLTFIELTTFPFTVGNINSSAKHSLLTDTAVRVPLNGVAELADKHFEIVKRDGTLHIKDLGSPQGTMVNGEHLSKYAMNATAKLKPGENKIIAGKDDSPVRFIINIPKDYGC
jgi:hypothetical protein